MHCWRLVLDTGVPNTLQYMGESTQVVHSIFFGKSSSPDLHTTGPGKNVHLPHLLSLLTPSKWPLLLGRLLWLLLQLLGPLPLRLGWGATLASSVAFLVKSCEGFCLWLQTSQAPVQGLSHNRYSIKNAEWWSLPIKQYMAEHDAR